jgi:tetratricopeptide (TPR) repeat protein
MKICAYVAVPPDSGPCGPLQQTLSNVYRHEGRTVEAKDATDSAPSGIDADLPPDLVALHKSAQKSEKDGLYPDAEFSYRQAVTYIGAHPKWDGGKMPADLRGMVSDEYNNIGRVLEKEGRNDLAEEFYKKAISSREAMAAERQIPLRSFNFSGLMSLYQKEGRLSEMEPIFQHALDLQEKGIGESGINVARTLVSFGNLYKDEAKYAEAEALYGRAMKIYEANLGLLDRQEASVLRPYVDLLHKLHQDAKAAEIQAWINMIEKR